MKNTQTGVLVLGAAAVLICSGMAHGQGYPDRPVRIVTAAPGANLDFTARLIGQGITQTLGQPVIIENRSSGIIPMLTVAKAPPDGHTLLLYGTTFWIGPLLKSMPYQGGGHT